MKDRSEFKPLTFYRSASGTVWQTGLSTSMLGDRYRPHILALAKIGHQESTKRALAALASGSSRETLASVEQEAVAK